MNSSTAHSKYTADADESSLLAHLVPRITNRIEDTATDALAFILNKSEACRRALISLLSEPDFPIDPIMWFETQVTHEDGSRPDMIGYDRDGCKRLIVESKFWAALGEEQASGYLRQLEEVSGLGVLLFIAPASRIETLWAKIERQTKSGSDSAREGSAALGLKTVKKDDRMRSARVAQPDKRLMLVSWDLLLGCLAAAVPNESLIAADIRELRGLALGGDMEGFKPIHSSELDPSIAQTLRCVNQLIDDAVEHGVKEGWISDLKEAPEWEGYGRWFKFIREAQCDNPEYSYRHFLCVRLDYWATRSETPMWLWLNSISLNGLRSGNSELAAFNCVDYPNRAIYVPIHLKTGVEYDVVLYNVVSKLRRIAEAEIVDYGPTGDLDWGVIS